MKISAQSEVYYVHDFIWERAGMKKGKGCSGCLCIGCLEKRIGRKLMPMDFPPHPFLQLPGTPRLLERQGRSYVCWGRRSGATTARSCTCVLYFVKLEKPG